MFRGVRLPVPSDAVARGGVCSVACMTEEMVPVFRVADAASTARWYTRMGFRVVGEHRFAPELPLYLFLERGGVHLHLSEHAGDAPPDSLVYFWVHVVDLIAAEFGVEVTDQPWAREIELEDPDGNRLRVATTRE